MLTKTFEYTDYNGVKQVETLYFNMNKAEIAAMQVRMDGKFIDHIKELVNGNKVEELFGFFQELVLNSYGEKSEDGKRFHKTPEMREEFAESIAYSELIAELMTDPNRVKSFTRGILPPDFQNVEIPDSIEGLNAASAASLPSGT